MTMYELREVARRNAGKSFRRGETRVWRRHSRGEFADGDANYCDLEQKQFGREDCKRPKLAVLTGRLR